MATQNSSAATIEATGRALHGLVAQAHSLNALYLSSNGGASFDEAFSCLAHGLLGQFAERVDEYVTMVGEHAV